MNKILLVLTVSCLVAGPAFGQGRSPAASASSFNLQASSPLILAVAPAQQLADVTGNQLLLALVRAKGLDLTLAKIQGSNVANIAAQLGISVQTLQELKRAGNNQISVLLATRATLESVGGLRLTDKEVEALLAADPGVGVTSLAGVASLIDNPASARQLANRAVELAKNGVTPRGPGENRS